MKEDFKIQSYCHIKKGKVSRNGKTLFQEEDEEFSSFIKSAYKDFETGYPKFFKMDNLSKLAFLAADVLLKKENLNLEVENNIALVFSNRASSLDTDRKHQQSIENKEAYFPSPATFVYTLPNICLGEISIKYKLYSENSFFIFADFNAEYLYLYAKSLLQSGKAEQVLCGWVDYDEENGNDSYEAFLYLVKKQGEIPHEINEINQLYQVL